MVVEGPGLKHIICADLWNKLWGRHGSFQGGVLTLDRADIIIHSTLTITTYTIVLVSLLSSSPVFFPFNLYYITRTFFMFLVRVMLDISCFVRTL